MSQRYQPTEELQQLANALCSGTLTQDESRRLEEHVAQDANALAWLVDLLNLDAELRWVTAAVSPGTKEVFTREDDPTAPPADRHNPWQTIWRAANDYVALSLIISSLFLTIILLSMALWKVPDREPAIMPEADPVFVAEITATQAATWDRSSTGNFQNRSLFAGESLVLNGGFAEVTFADGTVALIEAPAEVRIRSGNACDLLRGKLTAVAGTSNGFVVETLLATITDVGTEFGVAADEQSVDAEVFDGEIVVERSEAKDQPGQRRTLTAGESIRIRVSPNGPVVERISSTKKQFVRVGDLEQSANDATAELPVTRGLALWLAADRGVRVDSKGGVIAWRDTLAGDNKTAEPAEQPLASKRPKWVADGMNGKPAVRFDGKATRLDAGAHNRAADQTVIAVLSCANTTSGQILNDDGEATLVFLVSEEGRLGGRIFGSVNGTVTNVGLVQASQRIVGVPIIAAYRVDARDQQSELFINGTSQGVAAAPISLRGMATATIGSHPTGVAHFDGLLAELLVYDIALNAQELELIGQFLENKYQRTD